MSGDLEKYKQIIGEEKINELHSLSEKLKNKKVVMINSSSRGGGVAEILKCLVPLMNQLGIKTKWLVLKGNEDFFKTTKSFHNALQGDLSINHEKEIRNYKRFYDENLESLNQEIISELNQINDSDIVVIHDPQVLGLIKYKDKGKWVWRFHPDLSNPHRELWNFVEDFANKYDKIIVSKEEFIKGERGKYTIISPSIDAFSEINRELNEEEIQGVLSENNLSLEKPIVSQISRLDKWKDPVGVIRAYMEAKKNIDCQLVLVYNGSKDDPEGQMMYEKVIKEIEQSADKDIHLVRGDNYLIVNAIQRVSSIILQKSLKEGFALTVSEGLWKGTPVIGTRVGGIPLQIINGVNGYLVETNTNMEIHIKETAKLIEDLLLDEEKRKQMGVLGKEIVKNNFLITRHLKDYLQLFNELSQDESAISQPQEIPLPISEFKNPKFNNPS